tara:strand:+ start:3764 stop:3883 length:120 start_codon:yes stop_codon:yes gene_type:complete
MKTRKYRLINYLQEDLQEDGDEEVIRNHLEELIKVKYLK